MRAFFSRTQEQPGIEDQLAGLLDYLRTRLRSDADHCIVCDEALPLADPLPAGRPAARRPRCVAVCGKVLCKFNAGCLLHDLALLTTDVPVDVLVSLAVSAARSPINRARFVLGDQLPSVGGRIVDPTDPAALLALDAALLRIPSCTLVGTINGPGGIENYNRLLSSEDPSGELQSLVAFAWGPDPARPLLIPLPLADRVPGMGSALQFKAGGTADSAPQRAAFARAVAQRGGETFLAFHGSLIGNWHGILLDGLRNLSDDQALRANGAAYGSGIYLARFSHTSLGYSRPTSWSMAPGAGRRTAPPTRARTCRRGRAGWPCREAYMRSVSSRWRAGERITLDVTACMWWRRRSGCGCGC